MTMHPRAYIPASEFWIGLALMVAMIVVVVQIGWRG
jgi:hypothetical protein